MFVASVSAPFSRPNSRRPATRASAPHKTNIAAATKICTPTNRTG